MRNKEDASKYNRELHKKIKNEPWYKEQKRNWYLANAEKISKANKEKRAQYRALHPRVLKTKEEIRASRKAWAIANREKLNTDSAKRRSENLEKYKQYAKGYYRENLSFKAQYGRLKISTRERNLDVTLSLEEFIDIVSKICNYCGEGKERRGIDRMDNLKGYTLENSASCCKICNYMKKTMTIEEFLTHVKKIANYRK